MNKRQDAASPFSLRVPIPNLRQFPKFMGIKWETNGNQMGIKWETFGKHNQPLCGRMERIYDFSISYNLAFDHFARAQVDAGGNLFWDIDPTVDSEEHWNNRIDFCRDACYLESVPAI